MKIFLAVPSVPLLWLGAVCSALVLPQLELLSQEKNSRQLQEARPAPQQGKDHHLPHSNLDGSDPARSRAPPGPAGLSGTGAGRRGARGAPPLRGGPMSAAPEKTLEAGVRLPPQSRMSPRTQGAPGRTASEAGSRRSLSGRQLSSGRKKERDRGGGGREVAARLRGAGQSAAGHGVGCAEKGAGCSRSR